MKKIVILGSTGSIGTQALDVIARHPDRFEITGLAAGRNLSLLREQIQRFRPKAVSVASEQEAMALRGSFSGSLFAGEEGVCRLIEETDSDLVVSAIVGAAGLKPTLRAIDLGKTVALANKESLVIAGELMTNAARERGISILPIDSEHSAVFQALAGNKASDVRRIILTASGGPFLNRPLETFCSVTVDEALNHPNWSMGPKITIDSATLMNKGLEVIEASWLFGLSHDKISVLIHPQSVVHSMVEYCDGSVMAQMGVPDMRCAISYALAYPDRVQSGVDSLDLAKIGALSFFEPDTGKFPGLRLAYYAVREGRTVPAVLNAANEVAVQLFLENKIGFEDIIPIIEETLEGHTPVPLRNLEDLIQADRWARETARREALI